jgi:asparagine synthase (glutamine-hydrolysing)
MCGLTGFWDFKAELSKSESLQIAREMSLEIEHRGPDSHGVWCDESAGLVFAHQRLAIVDLSPMGHQPMISKSGRLVIIYNGEIFNTAELRDDLKLQTRGQSDTEVILEACELLGIEAACKRFVGMFAFALWDRECQELTLVRDRLGIKPLYWGLNNGILFFGSQLRSFYKHPAWKSELDLEARASYFRTNYIPAPMTIYKNIQKLLPGTILTIDKAKNFLETRFWDLKKIGHVDIENPVEQLHELLKDVVRRRMIADVPLGAFLSGGIDSSIIATLMQIQSTQPIKTFSIGSYEPEYDESKQAEQIAKHLGTDHTTWKISDKEAQSIIPYIAEFYDEPFGDASQIPTYLVSKMARQFVTVTLSGDGGDELFAGYNRYWVAHRYWPIAKKIPVGLRNVGAFGLKQFPVGRLGEQLYKFGYWLSARDESEFYERSSGQSGVLIDAHNFVYSMQQADLLGYLPDDILAKVDRASMAVGLEARVPFLDHGLVEFAMSLSLSDKLRDRQTKWILRRVLEKYLPLELTNSKKMGFGVPIDTWLRGSLRDWAENLLAEKTLIKNRLDAKVIRRRWHEHLGRKANWQYPIWSVLMYQVWHERWVK